MNENAGSFPPPAMLHSKNLSREFQIQRTNLQKISYFCDTNFFKKKQCLLQKNRKKNIKTATGKFAFLPSTPQGQRRMIGSKELVRMQRIDSDLCGPPKGWKRNNATAKMHAKTNTLEKMVRLDK